MSRPGAPQPITTTKSIMQVIKDLREDIRILYKRSKIPLNGNFGTTLLAGTNAITGTLTFPTDAGFTNAPNVFLTLFPFTLTTDNVAVTITAISATAFNWRIFTTSGANTGTNHGMTIFWLAIGR